MLLHLRLLPGHEHDVGAATCEQGDAIQAAVNRADQEMYLDKRRVGRG